MHNYEYDNFLSLPALQGATSISANALMLMANSSSFPPPVQIDGENVWIASEIANWIEIHQPNPSTFVWGVAA